MLTTKQSLAIGFGVFCFVSVFIATLESQGELAEESLARQRSPNQLVNGSFAPPVSVPVSVSGAATHGRQPASVSAATSTYVAPNPMAQERPLPSPHLEMGELTPIFESLAKGKSIKRDLKLQNMIREAASTPTESFEAIKSAFNKTRPFEIEKRTLLLSGLMEIAIAARDTRQPRYPQMMDDTIAFVEDLLKDPDYVTASLPEGTSPQQAWSLIHHSTYRMNGGTLEASTWNQKMLGLGILKNASLPNTKAALARISNDRSVNPHIAYAAGRWAAE